MKFRFVSVFVIMLLLSANSYAQVDKEEKEEKKAAIKEKVDYNVFRRQMLTLKEYSEERKKVPAIQKTTKLKVKIVAYVDSTDGVDDTKTLTGYIRQDVGDNSANIYEVTFDRAQKKITLVKPTGETNEIEKDDAATDKKPKQKTVIKKKSKTDDDDDDEGDEDKPTKSKQKDKDED